MTLPPENVGMKYDWIHIMNTHEIVYLAKQSLYEFCLAVPKREIEHRSVERSLLWVRFKAQYLMDSFVLRMDDIRNLFEDLSGLME